MLIAIEIGGTKLQVCVGREDGSILRTVRGRVKPGSGANEIMEWIHRTLTDVIKNENEKISAIGIGFGGPIHTDSGTIMKSVQVHGWDDFKICSWMEEQFSIPTFLYNDSSVAGWGEYQLGCGIGTKQFFYTNIGSGIGGSVIINGQMFDGTGYGAGNFGQTRIVDWINHRDEQLENMCSGWAIEKRLRTPGYISNDSILMELCEGKIETLTCKMLGEAARENDAFAARELDLISSGIALGLTNVLCLLQPEKIAVGGGVSLIGAPLLDRIIAKTAQNDFISYHGRYSISQCELGEAIVLHGTLLKTAEDLNKKSTAGNKE